MERVLNNIIQILKDTQTAASAGDSIKKVKSFYFGDPILIPISSLPAVIVQPVSSAVKARGVSTDQENFTIKIKLVQNQKDYL